MQGQLFSYGSDYEATGTARARLPTTRVSDQEPRDVTAYAERGWDEYE